MMRLFLTTIAILIVGTSLFGQTPGTANGSQSSQIAPEQIVSARSFGAVCDGIHDDTKAIQAALDSLPRITDTAHGTMRGGAVELPYVGGNNTLSCLISPPFLTASPRVTLRAQGGLVVLRAVANSAPAAGKVTVTGATNTRPIVITAANNFSNGDTVVCQGVQGNLAANSWYGLATGPWIISSVTARGFTLNGSQGSGLYTSGGTCIKGTEKFMFTIFNPNGTGSPNYNFDVGLENVALDASLKGNQFVSGIMCNCSIGTRLIRDTITFGYRGLVTAPGGVDNVAGENLTFQGAFDDGPDPIGLFITQSSGTNTISMTNLKFTGNFGGGRHQNFTPQTPAVVLGSQITNTHLDALNFEQVGWPVYFGFDLFDVSVTHIVAVPDFPTPGLYPRVVDYAPSAQLLYSSGVRFEGIYKGYECGQRIGSSCDPALPVPTSPTDGRYYPLGYDSISQHVALSELDVTGPRQYQVTPQDTGPSRSLVFQFDYRNTLADAAGIGAWFQTGSSWSPGQPTGIALQGTNSGTLRTAAIFLPEGIQLWPRATSNVAGAQLWKFYMGSGEADSNPSTELISTSSDGTHLHKYFQFGQANGGAFSGVGVTVDPNGTEQTGFGGNVRLPAIKSQSGTRFVCVDSTGLLISLPTPCSGT